jgi:uncharacterized repeat protein (TIGR03803 family)
VESRSEHFLERQFRRKIMQGDRVRDQNQEWLWFAQIGRYVSSMLALAVCGAMFLGQSAGAQSLLYSFQDPPDGAVPMSGLTAIGNLGYGTTINGGANGYGNNGQGYGTIFKLSGSGKETVEYNFSGTPDGANPSGVLIHDAAGNLYGTTRNGGTCGEFSGLCGTVFKLDPAGNETVLYSFQPTTGDAENPGSGVTLHAGNLYGPAGGGEFGQGAIFKLDSSGKESVFYSFGTNSDDGTFPFGALIFDSAGNMYGVTQEGGSCSGGTIFKIDPTGKATTLYAFCGGATGATPSGPLVRDGAGNLYGVTGQGGDFNCAAGDGAGCGTIFSLSPAGKLTVLHAFAGGASDGAEGAGIGLGGGLGLIRDSAGSLYGATPYGGNAETAGDGTVFAVSRNGYTVLHIFVGGDQDGSTPEAPLMWLYGSLYGTATTGGASSNGAVFRVTP